MDAQLGHRPVEARLQRPFRRPRHARDLRELELLVDTEDHDLPQARGEPSQRVLHASGLLGEGARYDEGDIDMNRVIGRLAQTARFLVTETLEPDNDHAVYMREAQSGMASVLSRLAGS